MLRRPHRSSWGLPSPRGSNAVTGSCCRATDPVSGLQRPLSAYLVDGIRPVLSLQTEGAVLPVWNPSLPHHRAVQVVGRVELEPWLTGPDLKHPSTGWMSHSETHTHQRYQPAPAQSVVLCGSEDLVPVPGHARVRQASMWTSRPPETHSCGGRQSLWWMVPGGWFLVAGDPDPRNLLVGKLVIINNQSIMPVRNHLFLLSGINV